MAELSPEAQKAMGYWPQIDAAAYYRVPTAEMWSWIRDAAEEMGLATPGVSLRGVSELRGYAGRIYGAARGLDRAPDEAVLDASHMAEAPWARSLNEQNASPRWQVRFRHTTIVDGEEQTEWRTSMFRGRMPRTVGELRNAIDLDAEEMARGYESEHGGVSDVQILVR